MVLTSAQTDRACGAVLGSAVGDALGAGYEFGCAAVGPDGPEMIGRGLGDFAPGEWTDDTAMTWPILEAAAQGEDLTSRTTLDEIARGFLDWYSSGPADIGNQTRAVLVAVAKGVDLDATRTVDEMARGLFDVHEADHADLGAQTRSVLSSLRDATSPEESGRRPLSGTPDSISAPA